MKVLQTYPSLFFCDFEQVILLWDVVLFPPFCQVNCSSFKNQYKCHLLWGLLALPGRVSAFSARYLYPLCDLLFCTVIMSMPVFLPRLHAPEPRDCDALIFVCKAETGGQPLLSVQFFVYWVKKQNNHIEYYIYIWSNESVQGNHLYKKAPTELVEDLMGERLYLESSQ